MTDQMGLTQQEAQEVLAKVGPNALPQKKPPSDVALFLQQFKNPLVYVLVIAGIITVLLNHIPDSLIIFLSVFLNTVLGFVQEKKANQAFLALKNFLAPQTEVIRDGKRVKIAVADVVPGDEVVLFSGAKIPADGELTFSNRAYFDEAIITGESSAVNKKIGDEVYMGTSLISGNAQLKVISTGAHTRMGSIAKNIQSIDEDTPLKKQLSIFSKQLVGLVVLLIVIVVVTGLVRGNDRAEIFTTSVALAVSSIPEGLLVSMTVVLAFGMQRILKRRGLVKKLSSAETLGGVTTICIDKTGTLTEGKVQVVHHVGVQKKLAEQVVLANDLDDPMLIAAFEWGTQAVETSIQKKYPRLDSLPFSPNERFFASLHSWSEDNNMLFVNGAPDTILEWTNLSASEKQTIVAEIEELTSQGKRVIGFAHKELPTTTKSLTVEDAKSRLVWNGLLAFFDPVRQSVGESLALARQAGIKTIIITGDYPQTTQFVLNQIQFPLTKKQIILGSELEKLSDTELAHHLQTVKLFARTTPDQKHRIVTALQKMGEVVAMMGDGVNDSPAIHKADIGIAVNEASDVSKEAADLILLDSNFSTIIAAIEEGRVIFDNIRKIILYLLSDAFAEIIVVLGGMLMGLPLPITAVQIIWINLVSDGLPGLALTIDGKNPASMSQPPRNPKEKLVNSWMISLIAIVSGVAGVIALTVYITALQLTNDVMFARSLCFATLGVNSLAYVFSVRTLTQPVWKSKFFRNKWLFLAVGAGIFLQIVPFMTEDIRKFFGVVALDIHHWGLAFALSIIVFFVVEVFKLTVRREELKH